jgi:hypothetical protein
MPYGYDMGGSAIGGGIRSAGQSIAQGIMARAAENERKRVEEERKKRERLVAKSRLAPLKIDWTPEYDQMIEAGGTADDVAQAAQSELVRRKTEQAKADEQARMAATAEESGQRANVGVERARQLMRNPEFAKLPVGDVRRQSIADAFLRGTIGQQQEAVKALEPEKPEKPTKATDSEIERAARREYWKGVGSPKDLRWQLWVMTGKGDPPDKKEDLTPAQKAGDIEQSWRGVVSGQQKAQAKIAARSLSDRPTAADSALAVMTPEQVADSARKEAAYVGQIKQEAIGGDVPEATVPGLQQKIEDVRQQNALLKELIRELKARK